MKAERVGRAGAVAGLSYIRRAEAVPTPQVAVLDSATVLGIPETEFTPRVRDAVMRLMNEVEDLRRELTQTKVRLEVAEHTADQDQLLPVFNRRAFVRELTRHIAFSARYGTPASLVYLDLDGFKRINDAHGHAAGDAVLAHFAATLVSHVRESDVVGRLGGDEFGVILTHASQEQANRKAQALIDTLSVQPAIFEGEALPVGVSYGAFELRASEDAQMAMARADEAMYSRKRSAR